MLESPLHAGTPALRQYPTYRDSDDSEYLLLLHGWGTQSDCWQPLLSGLRQYVNVITVDYLEALADTGGLNAWFEQLLSQLPSRFAVMGWSLGGMLATRMAINFPQHVSRLITLASNLRFVADDSWPNAMPNDVFHQFEGGFAAAPAKTLMRFSGLITKMNGINIDGTKTDMQSRQQLKTARQWAQQAGQLFSNEALSQGLSLLGELDNRQDFSQLRCPGLHLFAAHDALVPLAAMADIQDLAGADQVFEMVPDASHGLPSCQTDGLLKRFTDFLSTAALSDQLDKRRVAQSFGKAASSYDSVAGLQRTIGSRMLAYMPDANGEFGLDLGCGTGHFIEPLQTRGLGVVGLDLSEGMLKFASARQNAHWLCADAEALPLADDSLDYVFSSLAIQWCHNLPALFQGLKRCVSAGGKLYIATLGPRTLGELRQSWEQVDGYVHVNRFTEARDLQLAIEGAGLTVKQWHSEDIVLQYDALRELTYELKALGAHNVNNGQSSGLTGRARIRKLRESYEEFRLANGKLPATYEVYYMVLEA